ncbi:hypothetical protein GGR51DRAFT_527030 [Nemania sp. FL0031]|nr:hypothetical protein GGR51DRAFT_527030 [Nemania sp. FL0031]
MLATDSRDNIFAFYGLGLTSLVPDYTASIHSIYSAFAKEAIQFGLSSQVWQYSRVGLIRTTTTPPYSLPSWVPDLPSIAHLRGTVPPLLCQNFTANKGLHGGQLHVDDNSHLIYSGYPVDCVSKLFDRHPDGTEFIKEILNELGNVWSH